MVMASAKWAAVIVVALLLTAVAKEYMAVATLPTYTTAWCLGTGSHRLPENSHRSRCNYDSEPRPFRGPLNGALLDAHSSGHTLTHSTSSPVASSLREQAGQPASVHAPPTISVPPAQPASASKHTLHLISLPPRHNTKSPPGESLVRECWRWKDSKGGVDFIPGLRELETFHSLFVGMEISVEYDDSPLEVVFRLPSNEESDEEDEGRQYASVEVRLPLSQCLNSGAITNVDIPQSSTGGSFSETFVIEECVALSNCARFDVILVLKRGQNTNNQGACIHNTIELAEVAARYAVAGHLQQQIASQRLNVHLSLPLLGHTGKQLGEIDKLAQRLTSLEGAHSISTHLSLIASGLAPLPGQRPTKRRDKELIFRPYSSRDAHILKQLKRTAEIVSVLNAKNDLHGKQGTNTRGGGRGRIKTLLDGALSAGKAARNEKVVLEIEKLKEYGEDGSPPAALVRTVAEAAVEHAVKPSVATCVARLAAMETNIAEQISQMRQRVNDVVVSLGNGNGGDISTTDTRDIQLQKMANKLLHPPTMQLREGKLLSPEEMELVVRDIEEQLLWASHSV